MAGLFTPLDELSRVLGPDLAKDFLDHRKLLRKPMTAKAAQLMAAKLEKMPDPKRSVEQSIMSGWTDVYPVKDEPAAPRRLTRSEQMQADLMRRIANEQAYQNPARSPDLGIDERLSGVRVPGLGWRH